MKKTILIAVCAGLFFSCNSSNTSKKTIEEIVVEAEEDIQEHFEKPKLPKHVEEYLGTYKGTIPCADCEGIDITLTLNEDHTFILNTIWVSGKENKENIVDEVQGDYQWTESEDGIITLQGLEDRPNKYQMFEGTLIQLDMDGKRITGPLADKYVLKKLD